jgi:hypothetical protein
MFKFFTRKEKEDNWAVVHNTTDLWEAEVIRAALLNENVPAAVKSIQGEEKGTQQNVVSVPAGKVSEAEMVIRRTSIVISRKEDIIAEQEEAASQPEVDSYPQAEERMTPEVELTSEPVTIAEKDDVGKIFYYEPEDTYELRLDMGDYKGTHFMSAEEWEEFVDFSAQRQEFFILLKEKYPKLADFLKENKMRPNFLKLVEYSYGKSQPPKKK